MLIDWFTVAAQALNFLILVWLMKRFLYKPVLLAIDTREKRIAADLADAAAKLAEAQKQGDLYRDKTETFDKERAGLLQKATDDAGAEGRRLLDEARKSADLLTVKRQEAETAEALVQAQSIARRTGEEVFAIARQALTDLTSSSLEERMVDIFLHRLRDMAGKAKQSLGDALKSATEPAVLRSAFELPLPQRQIIETALSDIFAAKFTIRYEIAPDLVSGIDLSANGRKVGWSMADYLRTLEKSHPALASR